MAQHGQRVGLFMALTMAAALLGAPAHAANTAKKPKPSTSAKADAGVEDKDAGTAATPEKDTTASEGAGRCTGKANFCGVFSQMYCSSQPGCAYMFGSNMCGGVAIACEKATNEAFCKKIKGCSWK
ncbi:hypothetical protein HRD49_04575 [Corallococcus exiguus]|uniref:hypothetical protein n=1 Tax=Corallococcus TaxID=83461 RepID=UPI000EA28294|nr:MULTISPECIES: hypothetical protein [Corallococcus]NNC16407.1 hypothetical protein [Corallococcus exiguus]NRD53888.1 hypothetical protein [Corallococcus exiguus]NRD61017.1 hypothetical protein [Corallococcus exiguus]RKH26678.1 hypothetical protein D7V77_13940 [Corallococcus sp. CA041A]RKI17823.1 hypothetical protein D7Y15_09785 [Corallococcus sp. AB030]